MIFPKTLSETDRNMDEVKKITVYRTIRNLCDGLDAHHGNSLRLDHDLRRDGGEVRQVGQNVHHRHYRHGYNDRQGQVPAEVRGHSITD